MRGGNSPKRRLTAADPEPVPGQAPADVPEHRHEADDHHQVRGFLVRHALVHRVLHEVG